MAIYSIPMPRPPKTRPTWSDVKAKLLEFDRPGLLALIQDLYAARKDNQTFLHTRFGLSMGNDVLEPYKKIIDRWLCPNVFTNQRESYPHAKRAIADYKKAIGDPAGLAELMVFYCEQASSFTSEYGNDDVGYYNALLDMFEKALQCATSLPADQRDGFIARLKAVNEICGDLGYGVGYEMDGLLAEYTDGE
jgi:hypothetical protein